MVHHVFGSLEVETDTSELKEVIEVNFFNAPQAWNLGVFVYVLLASSPRDTT